MDIPAGRIKKEQQNTNKKQVNSLPQLIKYTIIAIGGICYPFEPCTLNMKKNCGFPPNMKLYQKKKKQNKN